MNREEWFKKKWFYLRRFALMALVGVVLMAVGASIQMPVVAIGGLLSIPLVFLLVMVPLLHWKDRYIGDRSTLWGALILVETSGWFKIIYWFRHVLPDWRKSGRYANTE